MSKQTKSATKPSSIQEDPDIALELAHYEVGIRKRVPDKPTRLKKLAHPLIAGHLDWMYDHALNEVRSDVERREESIERAIKAHTTPEAQKLYRKFVENMRSVSPETANELADVANKTGKDAWLYMDSGSARPATAVAWDVVGKLAELEEGKPVLVKSFNSAEEKNAYAESLHQLFGTSQTRNAQYQVIRDKEEEFLESNKYYSLAKSVGFSDIQDVELVTPTDLGYQVTEGYFPPLTMPNNFNYGFVMGPLLREYRVSAPPRPYIALEKEHLVA